MSSGVATQTDIEMAKETKHDEIVDQLDRFYIEGLFPANSAEKSSASIKTSLWAASSVFALYLAYSKRVDNDQGKAHDLGQSVVKCMRGILFAWMRQSEKVEAFKANQNPKHALHLKFDLHSGLANDFNYPHLQIDVVSLYLIFLANFIASGLDIIYCMDEVTFIQNLVYYVERAYRTPDYCNWEPSLSAAVMAAARASETASNMAAVGCDGPNLGAKYSQPSFDMSHEVGAGDDASRARQLSNCQKFNSCAPNCTHEFGQALEIHASSIGMAKSALEAINGCNLFGGKGANWSIIYSDIDAHSRNRSIFETLLPRESRSRNTDSYLLAAISWPCFATNDTELYTATKSKILRKLKGKYGFKRYLRDPYGTALGNDKLSLGGGEQKASLANRHQPEGSPTRHAFPGWATPSCSTPIDQNAVQRETSFSSSVSDSSNISAGGSNEQPKAKQRKSSYFHRKNALSRAQQLPVSPSNITDQLLVGPQSAVDQQVNKIPGLFGTVPGGGGNAKPSMATGPFGQAGVPTGVPMDTSNLLQRTDSASRMSKRFEHIECEWPLFVCFLIIDGIFKQDLEQICENEKLLYERLLRIDAKHGDYLIPKYYYVPFEQISNEKCNPDTVERATSIEGSSNDFLYITGQSVLLITRLLLAGLVHPNELDPLRRHMPSHDRPKRIGRYSSFQTTKSSDLVVQAVLIAESIRLQAMMANYGIQTQTPLEVEPVQIWSSAQLVKVYEYLGVNEKLGLKGRPSRPIGALGTSKLYRICGQTIICYPLIFEVSDFYLAQDMLLLIDDIQNELNFIGKYWRMSGRPTVCIIIREEHLRDLHFRDLLNLLVQFKNGQLKKSGLRIKTGRLQNLISSSCIEHLDFLHLLPHEHLPHFKSFKQLVESPKESLLSLPHHHHGHHHHQHFYVGTALAENNKSTDFSSPNCRQSIISKHNPNKSRRLLCSSSSHNLQAIEERAHQQQPGTSTADDRWDQQADLQQQQQPCLDFSISDASMYKLSNAAFLDLEQNYTTEPCNSIDYYECYKGAPTWPTLIELLRSCNELSGQSQLLAILWEREGAKYCVDQVSVEDRLEQVSQLACQSRNWSVVRYCSAVLKRSVESLSPWLTSALVKGKQISLGTGPNERIINNPLTPTEIHILIYSTATTKNPCDAVLQQEIALYIGRLISTRPDYFDGILTIRVANFMSAMRSYLNIKTNERKLKLHRQHQDTEENQQQQDAPPPESHSQETNQLLDLRVKQEPQATVAPESKPPTTKNSTSSAKMDATRSQPIVARPLESLSPSDVRKLLVKVLNDNEQTLSISDRRQITGELCRVPKGFYDKVWSLLSCTNVGIVIGGKMLLSIPILTNMTQDDLNFALKVESLLSAIDCPKLRQVNVELLMALHVIMERNPEIRFDSEPLDLDQIINLSLEKFRADQGRADFGLREFFCNTSQTVMLYTTRTVFDCLLPIKFKDTYDFDTAAHELPRPGAVHHMSTGP